MAPDDWSSVAEIYRQGIATDDATFEREVRIWDTWDACRLSRNSGSSGHGTGSHSSTMGDGEIPSLWIGDLRSADWTELPAPKA